MRQDCRMTYHCQIVIRTAMALLAAARSQPSRLAPPTSPRPASLWMKKPRTISIPAKIAPRKLENLPETYPIEVIASWPAPQGKKAHETVVTFDVKPSEVHKALESLGVKPGKPAKGEGATAEGPEVKILLELSPKQRIPIEKALVDNKTGRPMPMLKWYFTGSVMTQPNPDKPEKIYGADGTGTLISIFPVTDETVFQTNLTLKEEPLLKLDVNKKTLPAEGTAVQLIIQVK